jgi:hypothetical protein
MPASVKFEARSEMLRVRSGGYVAGCMAEWFAGPKIESEDEETEKRA